MPIKRERTTSHLAMSWGFRQLPFWERVAAQSSIAIFNDRELGSPLGPCYVFTGHRNEDGYGRIRGENGKLVYVHRAVWERKNGPVPMGKEVCHKCDVRACIKEEHLFLGTHAENIKDMDYKKRRGSAKGSQQHSAKLREADIPEILKRIKAGDRILLIGKLYGVSESTIQHIRDGRSWRHVPRDGNP